MPYTAPTPSTVAPGDTFSSTAYNIISGDIADHEARLVAMGGVFTNEAARDAAIISPTEGMSVYLTNPTIPAITGSVSLIPTGITTVYNGSLWVCTTEVGSGSITSSDTSGITNTFVVPTFSTGDTVNNSVTLVTGTTAAVTISWTCQATAPTGGSVLSLAAAVSGATTLAASTVNSVGAMINVSSGGPWTVTGTKYYSGLIAGTNTFTVNATVRGGFFVPFVFSRTITVRGIA